jgi:hypothetical protein
MRIFLPAAGTVQQSSASRGAVDPCLGGKLGKVGIADRDCRVEIGKVAAANKQRAASEIAHSGGNVHKFPVYSCDVPGLKD